MTSTAPGAHPLPEEVDALLDPSGGDARVAAHVSGCERCLSVREGLREVRALLGAQSRTLPPEPPDLGARIAAALAAEPPLRPSSGATTARRDANGEAAGGGWDRSQGDQVLTLPARRRWPAYLAVAASVAVVGLGGTFLATRLVSSESDTSAGAAAEAPQGAMEDSSGGDATPAVPSVTGRDPVTRGAGQVPEDAVLSSGTRYTGVELSAQAASLVATSERSGVASAPDGGEGLDDDGTRAACLVAVGRPGAEPVATDLSTFEGRPAAVIVLPVAQGYDVLVVPAGCGQGDDRVLARTHLD